MAKVLVASTDPIIAALLGTLIEVERHHAVFPDPAETVQVTIDRERPDLVVIDCDHPDCVSEGFVDRARGRGVGVVLFSPGRSSDDVRARAGETGLPWFSLPIDRPRLGRLLDDALERRC